MATTIQISLEIQKQLFQLINELEKQLGHRVSYNDAIKYLLDRNNPVLSKQDLANHLQKIEGILDINDARKELRQGRKTEYDREKQFDRD
jgi:hypothetical protein